MKRMHTGLELSRSVTPASCTESLVRTESKGVEQCVFNLFELFNGEFGDAVAQLVPGERLDLIAVDDAFAGHAVDASQTDL